MAMKWRERKIKIRIGLVGNFHSRSKRLETNASVFGPLAVHPTYIGRARRFSQYLFTVTHMGTKCALVQELSKSNAMRIAENLAGCEWGFKAPENLPAETKAAALAAIAEARR